MQAMKKKLQNTGATAKVEPEVGEKVDPNAAKVKTGIARDFHEAGAETEKLDVISDDFGAVMPYPCFTAGNLPGKNLL